MEEDDPHGDLQREQLKEEEGGLNKANNGQESVEVFELYSILCSAVSL